MDLINAARHPLITRPRIRSGAVLSKIECRAVRSCLRNFFREDFVETSHIYNNSWLRKEKTNVSIDT